MSTVEFHFAAIKTQLTQVSDGVFRDTEWIESSGQNPEDFGQALFRYYAALTSPPLKSNPAVGFDLYHDLVLRHHKSPRPALFFRGLQSQPSTLSYAELHAKCSQRCAAWAAEGVRAGDFLCIIAPSGPELFIPLLSGLRMGLRTSFLPPLGTDFLAHRLRALQKPYIFTPRRYLPLLGALAHDPRVLYDKPVQLEASEFLGATSHTYGKDEPALELFSHLYEPLDKPRQVSAAAAYLGALRDGLLLFSLHPGKTLAAPEHEPLQYQPALLLSTLLQGATFLSISAHELSADSETELPLPLDVLLLGQAARDVMLKRRSQPLPLLQLWIVNPQEAPAQAWEDWAQRYGATSIPAATMLFDAASAGCLLFSLRRLGQPPLTLQPAPGLPFSLLQADKSGTQARGACGIWNPQPGSAGLLFGRRNNALMYAGTLAPTRAGRIYPGREVEEAVLGLPFVLSASVVNESGNSGAVTLLIFTGPEPLELAHKLRSPREAALRERIRLRLGAEFQPALIEQYAMYPRRRDGALDQGWCRQQLQAGTLRSREAQPLLRLLDRLRAACARTLAFETSAPQAGTVPSKGEETPAAHGRKDSHR